MVQDLILHRRLTFDNELPLSGDGSVGHTNPLYDSYSKSTRYYVIKDSLTAPKVATWAVAGKYCSSYSGGRFRVWPCCTAVVRDQLVLPAPLSRVSQGFPRPHCRRQGVVARLARDPPVCHRDRPQR